MEQQYVPPNSPSALVVVNHPQYGLAYMDPYGNIFSHPQGGPTPNGKWHPEVVQGMSQPQPLYVPPRSMNPRLPGTELSPTYHGPR